MCDTLQETLYLQREHYLLLQNQCFSQNVSNSDFKDLSWALFQAHDPHKVPRVLSKNQKSHTAHTGFQNAAGADGLRAVPERSAQVWPNPALGAREMSIAWERE